MTHIKQNGAHLSPKILLSSKDHRAVSWEQDEGFRLYLLRHTCATILMAGQKVVSDRVERNSK